MSLDLEYKFSIRRVTKTSDDDYVKALSIYNGTTPSDIKVGTNEITYWLQEKNSLEAFSLYVFVLHLNEQVVGMAMINYITKRKILIYEYMALKDEFRLNSVFMAFNSLINSYLSTRLDVAYTVVEISNKYDGTNIDKESVFFKKIMCMEGFGIIPEKYYTLPLSVEDYEGSFEAFLYIKSNDIIKKISRETYLEIVNSIYYDYTLPWCSKMLSQEDAEHYKLIVDKMYSNILSAKNNGGTIEISYPDCPLNKGVGRDRTDGSPPAAKKNNSKVVVTWSILVTTPIFVVVAYTYFLKFFNISIGEVSSTLGSIFGAIATLFLTLVLNKKN